MWVPTYPTHGYRNFRTSPPLWWEPRAIKGSHKACYCIRSEYIFACCACWQDFHLPSFHVPDTFKIFLFLMNFSDHINTVKCVLTSEAEFGLWSLYFVSPWYDSLPFTGLKTSTIYPSIHPSICPDNDIASHRVATTNRRIILPLFNACWSPRVSVMHGTLTWTTWSLTCVRDHFEACVYTQGVGQRVSTTFLTQKKRKKFFLCSWRFN